MRTICGPAQTACRVLDVDDAELLWLLPAWRGADEIRDPDGRRESARTMARRLVRGSPNVQGSSDLRPSKKASERPSSAHPTSEPQVEPPDEPAPGVAAFVKKFASGSRAGASGAAAPVSSPPSFVRQISSTGAPSAGAPCFPLFTLGLSASELLRVLPFVNGALW